MNINKLAWGFSLFRTSFHRALPGRSLKRPESSCEVQVVSFLFVLLLPAFFNLSALQNYFPRDSFNTHLNRPNSTLWKSKAAVLLTLLLTSRTANTVNFHVVIDVLNSASKHPPVLLCSQSHKGDEAPSLESASSLQHTPGIY